MRAADDGDSSSSQKPTYNASSIASQTRSANAQELAGKPAKTSGRGAAALVVFTGIVPHPFPAERAGLPIS
ncbi:hypothetical protein BDS110ZK25_71130 [Bradyrhizobium diazoefficiens]|uniref:Uncharacterized protein n=1 Tax=Bradyrhizobium diazoefficiens TaxID=1355477 RepID=A0A810CF18_9BRAD|nr:hypothetical protein F07S3_02530 [Bradyrhizobium diazoefficiens]BBZ99355.1 hypothetical protein H12S4_02600 [Bradyrhizobium diazoefficiens]BCA08407.1 hypothetical protein BDHF08_02540 [Bradyrhizobium diazoefficiens]BCA17044.1 hypothetical protein BDHH15_02590 [Bradyrhizobium diazoefficiens]BCE17576.1 hypothetical protein XF1B_02570 [Bradyrhizobium diazoefficiens]